MTEILNSLGWALLHSLWQGCLAMGLVVAFRGLAEKSTPSLRYSLQVLALFGCVMAFFVTFALYQNSSQSVESGLTLILSDSVTPAAALQFSVDEGLKLTSQNLTLSIAAYAPLLGLFWCLGFVMVAFKYMTAYTVTQRLRKSGLSRPSEFWENRFRILRLNSGVVESARLYISENVTGPLTIGFLKPIVLVPAGFLTGLPRDQVEAILLHELAHIRRYDYLVNLFQTAIKTVLFFNPAIHYISKKIDIDREQACDDFSVAQTRNPQALALGLASLRLHAPAHSFVMAADDGDTPLVDRLGRLVGQKSLPSRGSEHLLMPVIALIVMAGVYISSSASAIAHPAKQASSKKQSFDETQLNKDYYRFETQQLNGRDVTIKVHEDGGRWVLIEREWVNIDRNPEALNRVTGGLPTPPSPPFAMSSERGEKAFSKRLKQFETDMAYFEADLERYLQQNDAFDEKTLERIERDVEKAAKRAEMEIERIEVQIESQLDRQEIQHEKVLEQVERQRERALKQAERQAMHAEKNRLKAEKHKAKHIALRETLYGYLQKDGYVPSRNQLVIFKNENNQWIVNGRAIAKDHEDKYCKLISSLGIVKGQHTQITLKPKSTHIHSVSNDGQSKETHDITIGEFNHDTSRHRTAWPVEPAAPIAPADPIAPVSPGYPQPINYTVSANTTAFIAPLSTQDITARFGDSGSLWPKTHHGIDYKAPLGTPIFASATGVVKKAAADGKYGNTVIIAHDDGYQSVYAHMNDIIVSTGQQLRLGQQIGTVGSTGQSTGPHLHFEIRKNGQVIDPLIYLKRE